MGILHPWDPRDFFVQAPLFHGVFQDFCICSGPVEGEMQMAGFNGWRMHIWHTQNSAAAESHFSPHFVFSYRLVLSGLELQPESGSSD